MNPRLGISWKETQGWYFWFKFTSSSAARWAEQELGLQWLGGVGCLRTGQFLSKHKQDQRNLTWAAGNIHVRILQWLAAVRLVLVQPSHLGTSFSIFFFFIIFNDYIAWSFPTQWSFHPNEWPASWKLLGTGVHVEFGCLVHCCTAAQRRTHQTCPARATGQNFCENRKNRTRISY